MVTDARNILKHADNAAMVGGRGFFHHFRRPMHIVLAPDRLDIAAFPFEPARPRAVPARHRPPALAVIAPTLDERDNVDRLLAQVETSLADRAWELIFVDDGSTDGTPERIEIMARERPNVRLIRRHGRRGLSSAILEGMLSTVAPVVAVIDADLQHDATLLPALADAVEGGADVAVGTRYAGSGSVGDWDRSRARISAMSTRLAHLVSANPCSDPLSGFFAVRRSLVLESLPRLSAVGFKLLLDLLASSPVPLRIAERPYRFACRTAGESKLDAMVGIEYGLLLADKLVGRWVPPPMLLGLARVGLGLLVNMAVLACGIATDLGFALAQSAAVLASVAVGLALNHLLTHRDRRMGGGRWWRGLAAYGLVCAAGATAQLDVALAVFRQDRSWLLAGLAGATVAAIWTYAVTAMGHWKRR